MKKTIACLVFLLCLLFACCAAAETFVFTTPPDVQGVMLMDANANQVTRVLSRTPISNGFEWTLEILPGASGMLDLYTKNASGDWIRGNLSFHFGGAPTAPAAPAASAPPWLVGSPDRRRVSVYPLPSDERYQSRCGPNRSYHGGGAYKTYKIEWIDALFIEDDYVFVDFSYSSVGRRRLYFQTNIFTNLSGVPTVQFTSHPARTTASILPYFGPGRKYDDFEEAQISAGTSVSVLFEENGWVFAEFNAGNLGTIRAWLPASDVEPK